MVVVVVINYYYFTIINFIIIMKMPYKVFFKNSIYYQDLLKMYNLVHFLISINQVAIDIITTLDFMKDN